MKGACLHQLSDVLEELAQRGFYGDVSQLITDHRQLKGQQDVFIAIPGARFDPRTLADDLIESNRCGIVLVDYSAERYYRNASVVAVEGLSLMVADLAAEYYQHPSSRMSVIGVTGTNGKTTVTRWLAQGLTALGKKAAVIGTLGYGAPDALKEDRGLTTPDVVGVHRILSELLRDGFEAVCVEASSIGLEQGRLTRVQFGLVAFTNLTQDHLDYHGDMQAYACAKMILATWPKVKFKIANIDDPIGVRFLEAQTDEPCAAMSVGRSAENGVLDVTILSSKVTPSGVELTLYSRPDAREVHIQSKVVGQFNEDNLALVYACLRGMNFDADRVVQALASVTAPPGRMEVVESSPCTVVDYAHTPDALDKVIKALRPQAQERQGALQVLFGCGGDRDVSKRPLMGKVAAELADKVWITSDNPRSEDPSSIIEDILAGIDQSLRFKVTVNEDRVQAIRAMIRVADPQDVLLLAGKGHEKTQQIGTRVIPHCDAEVARTALQARGGV